MTTVEKIKEAAVFRIPKKKPSNLNVSTACQLLRIIAKNLLSASQRLILLIKETSFSVSLSHLYAIHSKSLT